MAQGFNHSQPETFHPQDEEISLTPEQIETHDVCARAYQDIRAELPELNGQSINSICNKAASGQAVSEQEKLAFGDACDKIKANIEADQNSTERQRNIALNLIAAIEKQVG